MNKTSDKMEAKYWLQIFGFYLQSIYKCFKIDWFGLVLWHINLCRLFNAKSIFYVNNQFYLKQFGLAWVHSLIIKNISISNYSVIYNYSV